MTKKVAVGMFIAAASVFLLAGCGQQKKAETSQPAKKTETTTSASAEKSKAKKLLTDMTLEEKVGQLFFVRVPAENQIQDIKQYHLGGYILFDRDMEGQTIQSLKKKVENYQAASKTPLLIASDEEGGDVSRLSYNHVVKTPFKSPQELYQNGGWENIVADIDAKAKVFHEIGIDAGLAPDADVATDPESFIYNRTIGLDAAGTSEYVTKSVEAMQKNKIGSTLKHFPGYGNNKDSHVEIVTDTRPLSELQQNDFKPFEAGIKAGADSILVSHNIVNAIDPDMPASISKNVHQVIRHDLKFDGVVMTDDMDMAGLADFISQDEAGLQALKAGNDLVMSSSYATQIPYVVKAIKAGDYSEKQLDQSVERVLEWKEKLGLL